MTEQKPAQSKRTMKKLMTIFGAMIIASVMLTSCGGNSIESDAKKYAELSCKAQKLATEGAYQESTKLMTEAASLATEMQGKYKDASDYQKFSAAYSKALADCK